MSCELCGSEYPTSRFPNLELGVICDGCLTGEKMDKLDEAIKAKTSLIARQVSSLGSDEVAVALPKLKNMLASVYGDFGGPEAYGQHFYWVIRQLSSRKPIPSAVGTLMLGFMKLHHQIEQADDNISAREMTDDQLRMSMEIEMMKLVVEAASEPAKRKALEKVLGTHGLKLENTGPKEMIDSAADASGVTISPEDLEDKRGMLQRFVDEIESRESPDGE